MRYFRGCLWAGSGLRRAYLGNRQIGKRLGRVGAQFVGAQFDGAQFVVAQLDGAFGQDDFGGAGREAADDGRPCIASSVELGYQVHRAGLGHGGQ